MASITFSVDKILRNEAYIPYVGGVSPDVFLLGDSISGDLNISIPKSGKLKHKEILVKLVGRYTVNEAIQNEFQIHEIRISQNGVIDKVWESKFSFKDPKIQCPSYKGRKMSLTYHIICEIKQVAFFQTITSSQEVIFLDPVRRMVPVPPLNINVSKGFSFDMFTNKGVYANDEFVSGEILFSNAKQTKLEKIVLELVVIEKLREKKEVKTEESSILKYELIDGEPRPGSLIPFRFSLKPLQIWTFKLSQGNSNLNVDFRIDLYTQKDGVQALIAHHPIHFYQREL